MKSNNVNHLWSIVKEKYPDARFSFWYQSGELIFYPNGEAENTGREFSAHLNGEILVITEDF